MPAPSLVALGTAATGTAAAVSVPWPAGHAAGDIGLIVVESSGLDPTLTPPAGWAHVTPPVVDVATAAGSTLQILWKRATTAAEAAVSLTATDHIAARMSAWRGCVASGFPFDSTAFSTKTTASTAVVIPALRTGTIDTRVIYIATRPDDLAGTTSFGVATNAGITGLVEHYEAGTISGNGGGYCLGSGTVALPTALTTTTLTATVSVTNACAILALASENPALAAFSGAPGGSLLRPEPISNFETTSASGAPLTVYGGNWGRWRDASGNAGDLIEPNAQNAPFAENVANEKVGYLYGPVQSTAGGGATTLFYLCLAFDGYGTYYYGTLYSDVNGPNTGFQLTHNAGFAPLDLTFSVGTGAARVSASVSSGTALDVNWAGRAVLEAWYDGTTINLRLNRGTTATATVGAAVAAGLSTFSIAGTPVNTDAFDMRLSLIVVVKNSLPSAALRSKIADQGAARSLVTLAAAAAVNGSLASTEGADTAAAAGAVKVSGALGATEGADAAAVAGAVKVSGLLASTEAADTAGAAGAVKVSASLASTEAADTAAAAGAVGVSGSLAGAEAADTAAVAGAGGVSGSLSGAEAADAAAAAGAVSLSGSLAGAETGADAAAVAAGVAVSASLAAAEGADAAAAAGAVGLSGSLAGAESGADAAAVAGGAGLAGPLAASEAGADAAAAAGAVKVSGTLAGAESGADAASMAGTVVTPLAAISGSLAGAEAADSMTAGAFSPVIARMDAATEAGADAAAAAGGVTVSAALAGTEAGADTAAAAAGAVTPGTMAAAEAGQDSFSAYSASERAGTMAAAEAGQDAAAVAVAALIRAALAAAEAAGADAAAAVGALPVAGAAAAQESEDGAALAGRALVAALLAAAEGADALALAGLVTFPPVPSGALLVGDLARPAQAAAGVRRNEYGGGGAGRPAQLSDNARPTRTTWD